MDRKIEPYSLVDTFYQQGTTTANLVSDMDAHILHQIKKDWIKIALDREILNNLVSNDLTGNLP